MRVWVKASLCVFGFGTIASAVPAADLALIVGTEPADAIELLGDALNARGYEIYDRTAAGRDEVAAALVEIAERLPEVERLILFFAGDVQAAGPRAWLLPPEFDGSGRIDATLAGLPLDLLLDLAAEAPGRSAVVIGAEPGAVAPDRYLDLTPGVGAPVPPQGVLLIAGPAEAAIELVLTNLLGNAPSVAEALAQPPTGVMVAGYLAPDAAFIAPAGVAVVTPPHERAPEAATPATAADLAEAAEAALGLSQAARARIQEQLTVLGYDSRGIDGVFGPGTRSAVTAWQQDVELDGTGYVNDEQIRLLAALAEARGAELAAAAARARETEEAADAAFWRATGSGGSAADLRAYLERYPNGLYGTEARAALDAFAAEAASNAAAEDRAAWKRAKAADDEDGYRRYLDAFPEGAFAEPARARAAAAREARGGEQRGDPAEAARVEEGLGLGRGSRALIEGQLAALGFDVGASDGEFDAATRRALRRFQKRQGLEITGYMNQATVQGLIVASLGLR